jgi:hypothetical protein
MMIYCIEINTVSIFFHIQNNVFFDRYMKDLKCFPCQLDKFLRTHVCSWSLGKNRKIDNSIIYSEASSSIFDILPLCIFVYKFAYAWKEVGFPLLMVCCSVPMVKDSGFFSFDM